MSNILTQEFLKQGKKGVPVNGIVLIKDYTIQLTKNNTEYITGTLMSGTTIGFKAWNKTTAFTKLKNEDYQNMPCVISGSFDEFNGVVSINIDTVVAVEGYTADQFLPIKYNAGAYFKGLQDLCKSLISDKGFALLNEILFSNSEVNERFMYEFAAKNHHDNCKSGLLAHTYKVVSNTAFILNQYKGLYQDSQDLKDLLIIGATLHDLGKIWELNYGSYQPCSVVTHRYLGLEYISKFKDKLVENYGIDWYYNLASIFLQHHGEFDDDCRSLYAQIIHMADMMDADFTTLVDSLDNAIDTKIRFRDKVLSY